MLSIKKGIVKLLINVSSLGLGIKF